MVDISKSVSATVIPKLEQQEGKWCWVWIWVYILKESCPQKEPHTPITSSLSFGSGPTKRQDVGSSYVQD